VRNLSRENKSRAASAHLVLNNSIQWASRWTHPSNKTNSQALSRVFLARRVLSQVVIRRLPFGAYSRPYVSCYSLTLSRMGELEPWIDENFVRSVWFGMGYQVNVKMIRDKFSGSEMKPYPLCQDITLTLR
jgi:hypothetical protein